MIKSKYRNVFLVDKNKKIEAEDCKVKIINNYAISLGKDISGEAVYTSMIKLGGSFLEDFKKELSYFRINSEWYSQPLNRVLFRNPRSIYTISTEDRFRCEIDTIEDYYYAKEMVKKYEI